MCLASSLRGHKPAAHLGRRWRASCETALQSERVGAAYEDGLACTPSPASRVSTTSLRGCWLWGCTGWRAARCSRSEEHTSELQSRLHLVCRLLLEKKKKEK